MNKRIVLIDPNEFALTGLYGKGLDANQIFSLGVLDSLPEKDRNDIINVGPGDAVMLIGSSPFKYMQQWYHYGVRNENYFDCSKLHRLSMTGGAYAKCTAEIPTPGDIEVFLDPKFTEDVVFPQFQQKVLKTFPDALRFLDWLDSRPIEENFGFDYEASGMPLDKWFELSGAAICNHQYGGFLALTDIRKNSTQEEYREILKRLGNFLEKRMDHIWVYNMQYEFQVSHRMLGVDLYNLCDASVVNVLDGHHMKKYSLKWTAQRVLGVQVWDQWFDRLSDLLENMYFEWTGKTKKDKVKVYKVTKSNFKNSDEWKEIIRMFPAYEQEFENLILEYWGCPFMNIPSDILGYYCNLDSFYTLQIYLKKKDEYSEEAWNVFLDNLRLGCRLHSQGLYIDEDFRLRYKSECEKMMAWGITYTASARCMIKMKLHSKHISKFKKYPPYCQQLLSMNLFEGGDPIKICRTLLTKYVDKLDVFEFGLDEGAMMMDLGEEFTVKFKELLKESMQETKFKGKIDETIGRKKKILGVLGDKVSKWIQLENIDTESKSYKDIETYLYYERAYKELSRVSETQLNDIRNVPETIRAFGTIFTALDYSNFISDNYFKCKSPIENDAIIEEMTGLYKIQTAYLASLLETINQLPGEKNYYKNLGITTPQEGFEHFMKNWENYCNNSNNLGSYPEKMYIEALHFWNQGTAAGDTVKDVWTDFKGYKIQQTFWETCNSIIGYYESPFKEDDLRDDFTFMRKFTLNYLLFKKYSKVLSTYIDGMFKQNNKWVIEGPDHIPLREADPNEPGAIEKCFVHYEINTKSSKRHSSGFHTIISHSDIKCCITTPPRWDSIENKWIFGDSDTLLSYYDINKTSVTRVYALVKNVFNRWEFILK